MLIWDISEERMGTEKQEVEARDALSERLEVISTRLLNDILSALRSTRLLNDILSALRTPAADEGREAFAALPDHWHTAIAEYTTHRLGCPAEDGDGDCECAVHQFREAVMVALHRHLRAPAASPADAGWRPIKTAPQDRTDVLISNPSWPQEGRHMRPAVVAAYLEKNAWRYMDGRRISDPAPTHWMPLPPAPDDKDPA